MGFFDNRMNKRTKEKELKLRRLKRMIAKRRRSGSVIKTIDSPYKIPKR